MTLDEYQMSDATSLAELVAKGEVHPHEWLELAMAQLEAINPRLNAVIESFEGEAKEAIDTGLPEGPLRGAFLIKDLGVAIRGHATWSGSRLFFRGEPESGDSVNVEANRL